MSAPKNIASERILKLLLHKGSITLEELVESLKASAPSIWRDLTRLEGQGD